MFLLLCKRVSLLVVLLAGWMMFDTAIYQGASIPPIEIILFVAAGLLYAWLRSLDKEEML
jgi:hypothetical protein